MCEYAGRLVAWLDGELPHDETTDVEWHLAQCEECRRAVSVYKEISRSFLDCYESSMIARPRRNRPRWVPISGIAAAAATLLAVVFLRPAHVEQLTVSPPPAVHAPALAFQQPRAITAQAPARRRAAPAPHPAWTASEPKVQIVIPADTMFPPGAVPAGFNFITEVSFAPDGSPQALRVWP